MHIIIVLAAIGLISTLCQWLAWWIKLPAILLLLLTGIIMGPLTGWLNPDQVFGHLLYPIALLSVAVILFDGSLTLKFSEWHELKGVVRNLISIGLVITATATALLAHWIFGFSWSIATLFGTITAVTGPTVIIPILRTVRPSQQVSNILRWEGIMIDPIGALLAVLVFGVITSLNRHDAIMYTIYHFIAMVVVGLVLGVVAAYALGVALRRHGLPEFLHNVATLTFVLATYVIGNYFQEGAGLLAVTVMGITLTNMKDVPVEDILGFKESLSILLISGLFIILAARLSLHSLESVIGSGILLFLALQFIVRPLSVMVCTWRSNLTWREKALIAWVAPRGILVAAITAAFAIRLQHSNIYGVTLLVPIAFLMIITTVIFQSATTRLFAHALGIGEPEPRGFLIIGANPVACAIGEALQQNNFRVLLASMNREHIHAARLAGLPVYYGNAISERADRHLDLVGIGRLMILTPQADLGALASLRYRREFGRKAIYGIQMSNDKIEAPTYPSNLLFTKGTTFAKLASLIAKGASIHRTVLTDNFDFATYQQQHSHNGIPLFALDPKNRLHIFTNDITLQPSTGWTIIALITS